MAVASAQHKTHGSSPSPDMLGVLTAVVTPPTPPSLLNSCGSKTVQKGQCQTVTSISGEMPRLRGEDRQKGY